MSYQFDTRAVHAGQPNDAETGSVTLPIYQTSTYGQSAPGEHKGYCYSRTGNPTRTALEECLAALEEAEHGIAFASGIAAVSAVLNTLKSGDHVVACRDIYGGSYRIFTKIYSKFGITFDFVDTTNLGEIERALRPNTALLWLESPSNPLLTITDLAAACALARERGIRSVVDNTFATPVLQRPLALGADIVLHSTTKYLNGHADVIGGALIVNDDDIAEELRFVQNAAGAIPAPQDCFLTLRGIKTLGLRVERHCDNTDRIAHFLTGHEAVEHVYFPGLPESPGYEIARKQQRRPGAMISFDIRGGKESAVEFTKNTRIFTLAESLGSAQSLCNHPATMTHASVEPEVRLARGLGDGLIRLSIGLEDPQDLIDDLDHALNATAVKVAAPAYAAGGKS